MIKRYLKILSQCLLVFIAGLAVTSLVVVGKVQSQRVPSSSEMVKNLTVSDAHAASTKKAVKKSSQSAVRILSWGPNVGDVSISSGTYFTYEDTHYVITVQHGITIPLCDLIQIEADGVMTTCEEVVDINADTDYALLEVSPMANRTAIRFPQDFVRTYRGWRKSVSILHPLVYTGYPNTIGPVTLSGKIMGVAPDELIYFNSYAWAGSSGSGVFNLKGKFVGYIMAIDVGHTEYGYDVLENVILVVPHYQIDWGAILKRKSQQ